MNLLLLFPEDFLAPDVVRVTGRRQQHLAEVLRAEPGRPVRVGLLGGLLGEGQIVAQDADSSELLVALTLPPPPPLPITLLLALPRPKALRRILQGVAACGIKRVVLVNTARVEKSYWLSPLLATEALREQLLLGLEQGRDTQLPEVLLRPRFRPFVEDELPGMMNGSLGLLAHPDSPHPCPCAVPGPVNLAIGPEGGFVPFERDLLIAQGFQPVHLGTRPLRVETAVPAFLGRLLSL